MGGSAGGELNLAVTRAHSFCNKSSETTWKNSCDKLAGHQACKMVNWLYDQATNVA